MIQEHRETITIVDGRQSDPDARRLVLYLPGERRIIDILSNEQRIYNCGSPEKIEDACGEDIYHLLEGSIWRSNDWWDELHRRVLILRAEQTST